MSENVFLKNKFGVIGFLLTFLTFILLHFKNSAGLFFDTPATFFAVMFQFDENTHKFLTFGVNRVRFFNFFLAAIPFNIGFYFTKNLPVIHTLQLYSASFFIVQFFALIFNYIVALRTKRFDIIAVSYFFYALFSIPNFIWILRESHLVFLVYFALLAFFLSEEKLKKFDYILIALLLLYMFESFETTIVFGLILFIFSMRRKDCVNPWANAFIGFFSLLAAIYITVKMMYLSFVSSHNISQGVSEWINGSVITWQNLFSGNNIIICVGILFGCFLIFYNKKLSYKSLIFILPLIYVLYVKTAFMPDAHIELQNYSFGFWFIFPVIIALLIFRVKNSVFSSNVVVAAAVFGILNLLWQINSCIEFGKYTEYLAKLVKNSSQTVINIPQEDFSKHRFLRYNTCFGVMHKSILLMKKEDEAKIIMPSEYFCDYSGFCMDDKEHTFYDKKNEVLYLQTAPVRVKTRFWDLTPVVEEFEKQGRVNN